MYVNECVNECRLYLPKLTACQFIRIHLPQHQAVISPVVVQPQLPALYEPSITLKLHPLRQQLSLPACRPTHSLEHTKSPPGSVIVDIHLPFAAASEAAGEAAEGIDGACARKSTPVCQILAFEPDAQPHRPLKHFCSLLRHVILLSLWRGFCAQHGPTNAEGQLSFHSTLQSNSVHLDEQYWLPDQASRHHSWQHHTLTNCFSWSGSVTWFCQRQVAEIEI